MLPYEYDYLFYSTGLSDFGGSISGGDFDGDGVGDILIGAPNYG